MFPITLIGHFGYYYDKETGFYYLQSRYYDPAIGRFISADTYASTGQGFLGCNMFTYCGNNPAINSDPTGHFMLSTAITVGAIIGGVLGAGVAGFLSFRAAKNYGYKGWKLAGLTALGALGGGLLGGIIGAGLGYFAGYIAGGTYANGLAAKAIDSGMKNFLAQANKVHHVLSKAGHNLSGYTVDSMKLLMRDTLTNGMIGPYKGVESAFWPVMNSEVVFTFVNGALRIGDMWIR